MTRAGDKQREQKHTLKLPLIFIQDHKLLYFSRCLLFPPTLAARRKEPGAHCEGLFMYTVHGS